MLLARYTADAWRGRIYAVRYFMLFAAAGAAIAMISYLHASGGFGLVLAVNAGVAFAIFVATAALALLVTSIESRRAAVQAAE
ncbi:MAG: MFS transporter, partial [Pseudolabrys sp.]